MPDPANIQPAQRLRIYIGENHRWHGVPLASAVLEELRRGGLAGATVFRGTAGFGAHGRIHSGAIEVLATDLPVVIEVIDLPERIAAAAARVGPMVSEGLLTREDVQILRYPGPGKMPGILPDRTVREVMTREVVTLAPAESVHAAWRKMLTLNIKAMPVVDAGGQVLGILTDEDLLERAGIQQRLSVALRLDPADIQQELRALENADRTVEAVMTRPAQTTQAAASLGAAAGQMARAGLKRLPVVDENDRLVGMLSRLDILRQVAQASSDSGGPDTAALPASPAGGSDLGGTPGAGMVSARVVGDIMLANFPHVGLEDGLAEIVTAFAHSRSYRLVVLDSRGAAAGLISDGDVVARVAPHRRRSILSIFRSLGRPQAQEIPLAGTEKAADLMSPIALTAPPDLPVADAVRRMLADGRKWLVVVDPLGQPVGLVDRRRLLEAVAEAYHLE
jgi:CBS-domain-containing membrane protein/PII-like signaling protein